MIHIKADYEKSEIGDIIEGLELLKRSMEYMCENGLSYKLLLEKRIETIDTLKNEFVELLEGTSND